MEANAESQKPSVPLTQLTKEGINVHLKHQNRLIEGREKQDWNK